VGDPLSMPGDRFAAPQSCSALRRLAAGSKIHDIDVARRQEARGDELAAPHVL